MGVKFATDGTLRPDEVSFLALRYNPVRILLREVRKEVKIDALEDLIEEIKRLTALVYMTNTARLSGDQQVT